MLEIKNITKIYHKPQSLVRLLQNFSCTVTPGEFVAIQGPSGSGKTTLLLIAGGLLRPDEGQVFLNGQDLYSLTPEERAKFRVDNIGFVFQQYHLIPYLTVLENVLTPLLAKTKSEVRYSDATARAQQLIEQICLSHRLHHTPAELSAGEKQRTALARAVLFKPKILFTDEITGNLDQKNSTIVLDFLKEFANSGGAVLMVTHEIQAAQQAQQSWTLDEINIDS